MKILSFDISSVSTGYCILIDGYVSKKLCGTINPNPKKTMGERLTVFSNELTKIISEENPDYIVIEDIFRGRSVKTFKVLAGFRGVALQKIFELVGHDPLSLMPSEARKLIGVKNTKEDAFEYINKKYKLKFDFEKDNDKTDAIVIALAALETIKRGIDERSIRNARPKKRRKRK